MPAAVAVPLIATAVGAGTSLIGGAMASSASKNAANIQYRAAQQAAQQARDLLTQVNPPIAAATTAAQQGVTDATNTAVTGVTGAVQQGQAGATGAAVSANDLLSPYINLGGQATTTLANLMQPGGDLNRNFTFADMQANDPGYQFRMDQASKALQASAAARGGALGGGTLQALSNLNQNLASSEYQNAFNRFTTEQQNRYNRLAGLVTTGANVSGQAGQNVIGAAQYGGTLGLTGANIAGGFGTQGAQWVGSTGLQSAQQQAQNAIAIQNMITNALTGGANAQAAGQIGAGNAWQTALGGVSGAASQGLNIYQQQQIMNLLRTPNFLGPTGFVSATS